MEDLKKFLSSIGLDKEHVAHLTAENDEGKIEDLTVDKITEAFKNTQKEVFMSTLASDIKKEAGDEAVENYKKTVKAKINKVAGLGLTRKEQEEIELDELITKAESHVSSLGEKSGDNDELKQEVDQWRNKFHELKQSYDDLEEAKEREIENAKKAANSEITKFQVDQLMTKVRDYKDDKAREWADEDMKDVGHHYIMSQIKERYDIKPDGSITNKDGTAAVNFEGNNTYKTVDEAYEYLFQKKSFSKKSNGGEGRRRVIVDGIPGSDEITDNARALLERAEKKASTRRVKY
jgi:hypothetical protein